MFYYMGFDQSLALGSGSSMNDVTKFLQALPHCHAYLVNASVLLLQKL
jgi:hypothetical protein